MKTVFSNNFSGSMTSDPYAGASGECAVSKHFDILSYPKRLFPLRGMAADTTGTGIGNIIVGSDNAFYGVGGDVANSTPTNGAIWKRGSGTPAWVQFTHTSGDPVAFNLLVEYHDNSGNRLFVTAATNNKLVLTRMDDSGASSHALTFANVAQGFVHPKNDNLYVLYDNKIALNDNGTWTDEALVLPDHYRLTAATDYGNYLAIACTPSVAGVDYGGGGNTSVVFLWDMDTTNDALPEPINWGNGKLQVLNTLDGVLIGITATGGSSFIEDYDAIRIKAYAGGVPEPLVELPTVKQTSSLPSATINPRVSFIKDSRLYFSIDLAGGSTSPAYHGLWSIGKSKLTGRYGVSIERVATTDNSETAVLAAAMSGNVVAMVYDAEGTLSYTNATTGTGAQYTATSVYETLVNPEMPDADRPFLKQLALFALHYIPLPGSGQVVAKYRVDGGEWIEIFTESTDGAVATEKMFDVDGKPFVAGGNYEFHIESTGFAQIVGYTYKYDFVKTLL